MLGRYIGLPRPNGKHNWNRTAISRGMALLRRRPDAAVWIAGANISAPHWVQGANREASSRFAWLMNYTHGGDNAESGPAGVDGPVGMVTDGGPVGTVITPVIRSANQGTVTDLGGGVYKFTYAANASDPFVEFSVPVGSSVAGKRFEFAYTAWTDAGQSTYINLFSYAFPSITEVQNPVATLQTVETTRYVYRKFTSATDTDISLRYDGQELSASGGYFYFRYPTAVVTSGKHGLQVDPAKKPVLRRGVRNQLLHNIFAGTPGPSTVPANWSSTGSVGTTCCELVAGGALTGSQAVKVRMQSPPGYQGLQRFSGATDGLIANVPYTIGAYVRVPSGLTPSSCQFYTGVPATVEVVSSATLAAQARDVWVLHTVTVTFTTVPNTLSFINPGGAVGTGFDISCPFILNGVYSKAQVEACGVPLTTSLWASSPRGNFALECNATAYLPTPLPVVDVNNDHFVLVSGRAGTTGLAWQALYGQGAAGTNEALPALGFNQSGTPVANYAGGAGANLSIAGTPRPWEHLVIDAACVGRNVTLSVNGQSVGTTVLSGTYTTPVSGMLGGIPRSSPADFVNGEIQVVIAVPGTVSPDERRVLRAFAAALTGPTGINF